MAPVNYVMDDEVVFLAEQVRFLVVDGSPRLYLEGEFIKEGGCFQPELKYLSFAKVGTDTGDYDEIITRTITEAYTALLLERENKK
ncbi:MAG TPA: hypothetical protein VJC39_05525 [Candidatus Nanoarchaeia archaeon]|nr:hypothetical protein [Candidatus Nanoarchaeia archaeon]